VATSTRLAEIVATALEREILDRGLPAGSMLGSEAELMERMGVSRAVFREAVRIVEHHNLARMRRGPGGGLMVTEPDTNAVLRAAELYLGYCHVRDGQIFEARSALELASVKAAAERITPEGIERLRDTLRLERQQDEGVLTAEHPADLHNVIAGLADNPAIALFISVLAELARVRSVSTISDLGEEMPGYHRAHEAIAEAVISGDVALAQHHMRRHLEYVARLSERWNT
jgi:DNA-binding FadR family transcriptional regulator